MLALEVLKMSRSQSGKMGKWQLFFERKNSPSSRGFFCFLGIEEKHQPVLFFGVS